MIATTFCSRSGNSGQRVSTSTGRPGGPSARVGRPRPQLVSLPGYPFVRQRHWVDYQPAAAAAAATVTTNGSAPSAGAAAPGSSGRAATNGKSQMEDTLQRIWAQCLGVGSIDRNANFFELGGDSMIAISVAMTAANEGLDLTPQDLYENPTVGRPRQDPDRPLRGGRSGAPVGE